MSSTDFDPRAMRLGDVLIYRRTVNLTAPPEGEDASTTFSTPTFGLDSDRWLSSASTVTVDPENPDLLHVVVLVSYLPQDVIDYQEGIINEARARAMQAVAEQENPE